MNKKDVKTAKIFQALGHTIRLSIVKGLLRNECNVNKIVNALKLPQSTVSQHLTVLKNAGVIKGNRKGVKICYKVEEKLVKKIIKSISK